MWLVIGIRGRTLGNLCSLYVVGYRDKERTLGNLCSVGYRDKGENTWESELSFELVSIIL